MILLLFFAFISGLVTILAPCIWPLLPIILSSSIAGKSTSHMRPLGITLGVILSFTVFTLAVSYLVRLFGLDPNILRLVAVVVIGFLGLTMIVPYLMIKFETLVSKLSSLFNTSGQTQNDGFLGGFVTGLSLGIVWSPCAGPILASIATLAATGQVTFEVVLVTLAYVTGVGIPLFFFAYGGQQLITKSRGISQYTAQIQKVFGVIMILTALAIFTNYDKVIQVKLLEIFPQFGQALNGFESNSVVTKQLSRLTGKTGPEINATELLNTNTPAPEFTGINKWLNPEQSLTMADLKGKVVLIDFWTYTCINCIRTLPHVTAWYDKYKDDGFVVIGVHTPEFAFEKDTKNVLQAIEQYNIHYPVAQDNDYATWNAYSNRYWPAEYLIDSKGVIRRVHFGEGEYDKMEQSIQLLLKEAGAKVNTELTSLPDETPNTELSPETYLGSKRMLYLSPGGKAANGTKSYSVDPRLTLNHFSFGGQWSVSDYFAKAEGDSVISYQFVAGKVYLVMKPGSVPGKVTVLLDGKTIDSSLSGKDVQNGQVTVEKDMPYELVNLRNNPGEHLLELRFSEGIETYAFTFGG